MKYFRIAEIFGPTIQGEGRRIGTPCYFVRIGGCDYRCSWCDSPHAVLPRLISQLEKVSETEIIRRVCALPRSAEWVVFSGGNPALYDLTTVQKGLHASGFYTMVETQGTRWNPWLLEADDVCISPKPPSSSNRTPLGVTYEFLCKFDVNPPSNKPYLKVVVFSDEDYEYAKMVHHYCPYWEMFLSVGNEDPSLATVGNDATPDVETVPEEVTQQVVLGKMAWLMEKVAADRAMRNVRVLPQLHVLAWGNELGR